MSDSNIFQGGRTVRLHDQNSVVFSSNIKLNVQASQMMLDEDIKRLSVARQYRQSMVQGISHLDLSHLTKKARLVGDEVTEMDLLSPRTQTLVQLLSSGNQDSYRELCELLDMDKSRGDERIQENLSYVFLKDRLDKLELLNQELSSAEDAFIIGDHRTMLMHHWSIIEQLRSADDNWLAEYFLEKCNKMFSTLDIKEKSLEAETVLMMGEHFLNLKMFDKALNIFDRLYQMCKFKTWTDFRTGRLLKDVACSKMASAYQMMGASGKGKKDALDELMDNKKAFLVGSWGQDNHAMKLATLNIGKTYLKMSRLELAYDHFTQYMRMCHEDKDNGGLCQALIALARCFDKMGLYEDALETALKAESVATEGKMNNLLIEVYSILGPIEHVIGNYEEARKFSNLIAQNDDPRISTDMKDSARIMNGVTSCHLNLSDYAQVVKQCPEQGLSPLIAKIYQTSPTYEKFETPVTQEKDAIQIAILEDESSMK